MATTEEATKSSRGQKQAAGIRWGIERAAAEFSIDRKTLAKRLVAMGERGMAGPDTCFSTIQICGAVYGDLQIAKIRRAQADAELSELELKRQSALVVLTSDVVSAWAKITQAVRLRISETSLSDDEKAVILADLRELSTLDYAPEHEE